MRRRGPQHVVGRPVPNPSCDPQVIQDAKRALDDPRGRAVAPGVGDRDLEVMAARRTHGARVGATQRHACVGQTTWIVDRQETLEERPIVWLFGEE